MNPPNQPLTSTYLTFVFLTVSGGLFPSNMAGSGSGTVLQELSSDDKDFVSVCYEVFKDFKDVC